METEKLKAFVIQGDIQDAISELVKMASNVYTDFALQIYQLSARYSQVIKEHNSGTIPQEDFWREHNSITASLLNILETIEDFHKGSLKRKKTKEEVINEIRSLGERFAATRKKAMQIRSNPTRLREKNEIIDKLAQIFIQNIELIKEFEATDDEGIIAGIANRYKKLPDVDGIDFFENSIDKVVGNFTKSCIANALAEIIYTGQLRIGDDARIEDLLSSLSKDSAYAVLKNIEHVKAELYHFLGKNPSS